jgi:hypothetical protein
MVVAGMIPPSGLSKFAHKSGISGDHTAQFEPGWREVAFIFDWVQLGRVFERRTLLRALKRLGRATKSRAIPH